MSDNCDLTTPAVKAALRGFLRDWSDEFLIHDVGPLITTGAVDSLCELFEVAGMPEVAQLWGEAEASGRAEGDEDDDENEEPGL